VPSWSIFNVVDQMEIVMPVLHAPAAPTHDLGGARFTSLATPTTGCVDTAVWKVEILPGTPATPHSLTREEVFVVLEGAAAVRIAGVAEAAAAGDAIVVPAGVDFEIENASAGPLRLVCCFPVGGQACMADGTPFTPPWAR
jgi:mannose-6-phosphate isomerase-like protein (cupin superfamily)